MNELDHDLSISKPGLKEKQSENKKYESQRDAKSRNMVLFPVPLAQLPIH